MNDEQIYQKGGTDEDIKAYAEQNGADLTKEDFTPMLSNKIYEATIETAERIVIEYANITGRDEQYRAIFREAVLNYLKSFASRISQATVEEVINVIPEYGTMQAVGEEGKKGVLPLSMFKQSLRNKFNI